MYTMEYKYSSFRNIVGQTLSALKYQWKIISYIENDSCANVYVVRKDNDNEDYLLKLEPYESGQLFTEFHFLNRLNRFENNYFLKLIDFGIKIIIDGVRQRNIVLLKKRFCFQEGFKLKLIFFTSPCDIKNFYIKIINSIVFLNSIKYVNGDIKPKNIVFDDIQNPYIIDFGLVANFERSNYIKKKEYQNGTLVYMSRDAHLGIISQRTDVESFGFVLYQILEKKKLPWNDITTHKKVFNMKNKFIKNISFEFYKNPYLIKYFSIIDSKKCNETPLFEDLYNVF